MWDDPFDEKLAHNNRAVYTELSALMKHSGFSLPSMTKLLFYLLLSLDISLNVIFGRVKQKQARVYVVLAYPIREKHL